MAAAAPVLAQAPSTVPVPGVPPQGVPQPPQSPATPEARMQKAVQDVRKASDRLQQIEVPMDIEPAFSFRA